MAAGGMAGVANAILSSPLELLKLRLQVFRMRILLALKDFQCAGQYTFYAIPSGTTMWQELGGIRNIFKVRPSSPRKICFVEMIFHFHRAVVPPF